MDPSLQLGLREHRDLFGWQRSGGGLR